VKDFKKKAHGSKTMLDLVRISRKYLISKISYSEKLFIFFCYIMRGVQKDPLYFAGKCFMPVAPNQECRHSQGCTKAL
jgi:hypothetical protein